MDAETEKEIEEIIVRSNCPNNFRCVKSGFEKLCKVKDSGRSHHFECFECLEPNPSDCTFAVFSGSDYFCNCQLRLYLSQKLKK